MRRRILAVALGLVVGVAIVFGYDTNIQVAVLSRFPFTARRPHTNENYLLRGRRFRVSRGFVEAEIDVEGEQHERPQVVHAGHRHGACDGVARKRPGARRGPDT